jgi:apolipoprotein N-acyltransferase
MNIKNKYLLSFISGVRLWLAWPPFLFSPLLFVALVPLFFIEEKLFSSGDPQSSRKLFRYTFIAFSIWNLLSTYWIWNASSFGMVIAVLLNSFLMSLPFFFYHKIRRKFNQQISFVAFIVFWITYEYGHMHWDLSWPWLTLGNGFSELPQLVQWYEYTGVFGGTLWILVANIVFFNFLKLRAASYEPREVINTRSSKLEVRSLLFFCLWLIAPVTLSLITYTNYEEKKNPCNIVVVQPNIDPYNEKFSGLSEQLQLKRLIRLSDSLGQKNTEYFIWPETALTGDIWEDEIHKDIFIDTIRNFLSKYKNGNVITGASTYRLYNSEATITARKFRSGQCCYDAFNTALQIENSSKIQIYHKSKLVAGVEQMPYPQLLKFMEPLALNLGGTIGSLGKQKEPSVLYTQSGIGAAPVICYESVYGEYITEYVKSGAQFIAIITNDGWWGNTQGYKQHASYARLRAIETRRSIARSANTGISCFINQRGDISQATSWWTPTSIKADINLNDSITFYVRYGDYIAVGSIALVLFFLIALFIKKPLANG